MSWLEKAACRGMGPDLFFPNVGENATAAKAVCASCPVRSECLEDCLMTETAKSRWGIRGGLAPFERQGLRSKLDIRYQRVPAACGTIAAHARHRRAGETPCALCKAAWATYKAERKAMAS